MTPVLLEHLQTSLGRDVQAMLPELTLCGGILLMLLIRLFRRFDQQHLNLVALVVSLAALVLSFNQWRSAVGYDPRIEIDADTFPLFSGLLVYDDFGIFAKMLLTGFTTLTILLSMMTRIPDREDSADFMTLLLGATLGMMLMAQANHLLTIFIAVEMASVPSYALAGFLKGRRTSSEASLKYVVYGGGAAGFMLYGMSLLAGKVGTGYLPDLLHFLSHSPLDPLLVLGMAFVFIGIAFKIAAVPFHFWCPDVFEGAPAEVAAFLSVASKAAALTLLGRIVLGLGGMAGPLVDERAWANTTAYLVPTLGLFAAVTMTFGNLAAYAQTNLKRLLAYSTIAHAGFMMMGLATMTRAGVGAVLFYLVIYLVMNLGAFAVVAFLRNFTGSEDLSTCRGLIRRSPCLVITLGFFLLSLLGLPPLAGFAAKFQIFSSLFEAGNLYGKMGETGLANVMYALLILGGLNTVLSLFYYVKVLKVMVLDKSLEDVEGKPMAALAPAPLPNAFLGVLAAFVLVLGLFWNPVARACYDQGAAAFREAPTPAEMRMVQGKGVRP